MENSNAKFEVADKTNNDHETSAEHPGQTTNLDRLAEVVDAQPPALFSDAGKKSGLDSLKSLGSTRKLKTIQEKGNDVLPNKKA